MHVACTRSLTLSISRANSVSKNDLVHVYDYVQAKVTWYVDVVWRRFLTVSNLKSMHWFKNGQAAAIYWDLSVRGREGERERDTCIYNSFWEKHKKSWQLGGARTTPTHIINHSMYTCTYAVLQEIPMSCALSFIVKNLLMENQT